MARKQKFDGIVVKREVDREGFVHAYDKNDRACWGGDQPERVVLTNDLRKYAAGLHIGQLGWTVPATITASDSYTWIDVIFDNGVQLPIRVYGIDRVDPGRAAAIATEMLNKNRNTRFDADPVVAERFCREWIKKEYAAWVDAEHTVELGNGHEEVYAFTFPSLRELAGLKGSVHYPVKIGYATDKDVGAVQRIRNLMIEAAAFPERPVLLLVCRTWNGRALETSIHAEFRLRERRLATAPGIEWFMTNEREIAELCQQFGPEVPQPASKPLSGAGPGVADLVAAGARVEFVQYPNSACVGVRIAEPKPSEGTH